jgi:hypothetical protein
MCVSGAVIARQSSIWGPKILELVKRKEREGFLSLLRRTENLVDEALVNDIHKLDISAKLRRCQYLFSDPFR